MSSGRVTGWMEWIESKTNLNPPLPASSLESSAGSHGALTQCEHTGQANLAALAWNEHLRAFWH